MLSFSRQINLKNHVREINSDKNDTKIALANVIWLVLLPINALVCNANASATLASKSLLVYLQKAFLVREKRSSINVSLIPAKGWIAVTDMMMSTMFMTSRGKMAILLLRTFIVLARILIKTRMVMIWRNWLKQTGENIYILSTIHKF